MKNQIKFLIITVTIVASSAFAGVHLNLPADPSEYRSESQFMQTCVELNAEVSNNESLCNAAWQYYSAQ